VAENVGHLQGDEKGERGGVVAIVAIASPEEKIIFRSMLDDASEIKSRIFFPSVVFDEAGVISRARAIKSKLEKLGV